MSQTSSRKSGLPGRWPASCVLPVFAPERLNLPIAKFDPSICFSSRSNWAHFCQHGFLSKPRGEHKTYSERHMEGSPHSDNGLSRSKGLKSSRRSCSAVTFQQQKPGRPDVRISGRFGQPALEPGIPPGIRQVCDAPNGQNPEVVNGFEVMHWPWPIHMLQVSKLQTPVDFQERPRIATALFPGRGSCLWGAFSLHVNLQGHATQTTGTASRSKPGLAKGHEDTEHAKVVEELARYFPSIRAKTAERPRAAGRNKVRPQIRPRMVGSCLVSRSILNKVVVRKSR